MASQNRAGKPCIRPICTSTSACSPMIPCKVACRILAGWSAGSMNRSNSTGNGKAACRG
jgi:hypothetical protein